MQLVNPTRTSYGHIRCLEPPFFSCCQYWLWLWITLNKFKIIWYIPVCQQLIFRSGKTLFQPVSCINSFSFPIFTWKSFLSLIPFGSDLFHDIHLQCLLTLQPVVIFFMDEILYRPSKFYCKATNFCHTYKWTSYKQST